MSPLASSIISTAAGIVATWFFAWIYYRKAGEELKREAQALREESGKLREWNRFLMISLQNNGLIDLNWKDGEPAGVNATVQASVPPVQSGLRSPLLSISEPKLPG
jgi:hypothetical protein